jgi:hypothetical protein
MASLRTVAQSGYRSLATTTTTTRTFHHYLTYPSSMMIKRRGIHNVILPFHSEDMGYTFAAAESQERAEVERLRRAVEKARREVKERDEVIEGQRKEIREMVKRGEMEMAKKGEMVKKGDLGVRYGGTGSTVQKVERVKRAGRMMELLMSARGREAYDPL